MCLCLCMQTKHRVVVHSTTTSLRLRIYSVYSNWNVQAIKTNEVNYYCVCVCFFSRPCNRELFATFSTCQQIVYIALFSDSHTFTSLVQCQTTCLFRDVHYSPLDNVYRWLLLLPKHKLNQHENKWKNNETFNITLRIFAWSTKHESHPDDVSLLQFITDSNNVVHRFTVQCHLMFEIAIHAKQKKNTPCAFDCWF